MKVKGRSKFVSLGHIYEVYPGLTTTLYSDSITILNLNYRRKLWIMLRNRTKVYLARIYEEISIKVGRAAELLNADKFQ